VNNRTGTPARYAAVAACAVVVYAGALWNRFAFDDTAIIVENALVHSADGVWRAFVSTYWRADVGGWHYRPFPVASYALDWLTGSVAWFHLVNLAWHAAASTMVALLARHLAGDRAGLVAGLLFAVHPVHVEAVANVVGRAELMAATCTLVAVWAALRRGGAVWSAAAMGVGLLCKENAAVAPLLVAWGWAAGLARPSRRQVLGFVLAWALVGGAYIAARAVVLHDAAPYRNYAAVFVGESPLTQRLTAVAALLDAARLLVFPLELRVDYSPAERTAVYSPLDPRFLAGVGVLLVWCALVITAWRRGRKVEAFGWGWIGIAFLPVSNLAVTIGVLVAERTLYLPSAGLVLALGAWGARLAAVDSSEPRRQRIALARGIAFAVVIVAAAVRTAIRVPVWRDDASVTRSMLADSPRSYAGHARAGVLLQAQRRTQDALGAFGNALSIYQRDASVFVGAADAAFTLGRPGLADSLLALADGVCYHCTGLYRVQAGAARSRGDVAAAESLLARARRWESQ
jgi:hypothetical protein